MTKDSAPYRDICSGIISSVLLFLLSVWPTHIKGENLQLSGTRIELHDIIPESRAVINIPSSRYASERKTTRIIFYALPNGNSIEQTEGRKISGHDEWRFDIQHISAQVKFLRQYDTSHNYIVVYLESKTKAWTSHASKYSEQKNLYTHLLDSVRNFISDNFGGFASIENQSIILASHSGGGRFVFNYILENDSISSFVERLIFIDSNYGFEPDLHTEKIYSWLQKQGHFLEVIAYVDTTVILNGKPIVSSKGGTGYRSVMMADELMKKGIEMQFVSDTIFKSYRGAAAEIMIKENPQGKIYHTVLVERNGLIHGVLSGGGLSEKSYKFWGDRAYSDYIEKL